MFSFASQESESEYNVEWVPSLLAFHQAKSFRQPGGMRGKIHEAYTSGFPSSTGTCLMYEVVRPTYLRIAKHC